MNLTFATFSSSKVVGVSVQELYYIHIYLFCSVEHCTYRNIVRDSKYPQNVSEILNCLHSLANNVLHSSSIYKLASAIYLALYIPQCSRKYIYTIIMAAIETRDPFSTVQFTQFKRHLLSLICFPDFSGVIDLLYCYLLQVYIRVFPLHEGRIHTFSTIPCQFSLWIENLDTNQTDTLLVYSFPTT